MPYGALDCTTSGVFVSLFVALVLDEPAELDGVGELDELDDKAPGAVDVFDPRITSTVSALTAPLDCAVTPKMPAIFAAFDCADAPDPYSTWVAVCVAAASPVCPCV
jgi:hypothetical protein